MLMQFVPVHYTKVVCSDCNERDVRALSLSTCLSRASALLDVTVIPIYIGDEANSHLFLSYCQLRIAPFRAFVAV